MALNCGQTVLDTKANGASIKLMGRASLSMLMEMFMKASGSMTKLKEKEPTLMPTVHTMKASGSTTNNTDTVLKAGLMVLDTKVNTLKVKKKAMVV